MYVLLTNVKTLDIYILISKCFKHYPNIATKNTVCFLPCISTYFIFTKPRRLYLCNLLSTYTQAQLTRPCARPILYQLFTYNSEPTNETMYVKEFFYL